MTGSERQAVVGAAEARSYNERGRLDDCVADIVDFDCKHPATKMQSQLALILKVSSGCLAVELGCILKARTMYCVNSHREF